MQEAWSLEGFCDVLGVREGKKSKLGVYHEGEIDKRTPDIVVVLILGTCCDEKSG